jgi:NAD(P)-dependent dehydrogenase (short-subunit alcohol dehydrogenase family)
MDLHLAEKSVLIAGSTSGIGFEAAEGSVRERVAVVVNGRDKGRTEVVGVVGGRDGTALAVRSEVSRRDLLEHVDVEGLVGD